MSLIFIRDQDVEDKKLTWTMENKTQNQHHNYAMIGENRQLVTDEPVEFEK